LSFGMSAPLREVRGWDYGSGTVSLESAYHPPAIDYTPACLVHFPLWEFLSQSPLALLVVDEAHVDVLPARRLLAVDRDEVLAGLEGRPGLGADRHLLVIGDEARHLGGQDAVEVNLRVLVVVQEELQVRERALRQFELAADPDVARIPLGADDRPRRTLGAEAAGALLPVRFLEVGLGPVVPG